MRTKQIQVGALPPIHIKLGSIANGGETLGTGGVIWDSGITLARFLEKEDGVRVAGKRVIELGSGTGLAGLAAAACGADSVLLTDMFGMKLLESNVRRNGLQSLVRVAPLSWGDPDDIKHALARSTDSTKPGSHYDVIIGSDVLYDQVEQFSALLINTQTLTVNC
jgi:predicted nicotinamide N-methyase